MKIAHNGTRLFDTQQNVLLVAEIGNNHEGNFEQACALAEAAAKTGVHAIKFQTFVTELFVSPAETERFKRMKGFELKPEQFAALADLVHSKGLMFISTPLDLKSAEVLAPLVDSFKIASGDNNFYPLIDKVCAYKKPMIFSTGLSDLKQVDETYQYIKAKVDPKYCADSLAVMHCTSAYPTPPEDAGLLAIPLFAERYACTVGYSDHTLGYDAAVAAVALGAQIIEKHFTLDKNYSSFRDHALSADLAEMTLLAEKVKLTTKLLGKKEKKIQPSEEAIVKPARRSIAIAKDLPAGHVLKTEDLIWIRPAGGWRPGEESQILNKALQSAMSAGQVLRPENLRR